MTESTFPAIGMADFDMERWILSTLEEDAATDENVEAIAQVECVGDELTAAERYILGGWQDDIPEDRVSIYSVQEDAQAQVQDLITRWPALTGRTASLVRPTREAHRFTLTIA